MRVRHAEPGDRRAVAPLLCIPEPGLGVLLGSPEDALRAARALFRSESALESYRFTWIAESYEGVVAAAVSVPQYALETSRVRTGLRIVGAVPWRAARVVWIGRGLDRLMAPVPGDAAFLACMAVDPRVRGLGIGRMLLQTVIAAAAHEGRGRLCLDVAIENRRARAFYERLGFDEVGRRETHGAVRTRLLTEGLIRLQRTLPNGA